MDRRDDAGKSHLLTSPHVCRLRVVAGICRHLELSPHAIAGVLEHRSEVRMIRAGACTGPERDDEVCEAGDGDRQFREVSDSLASRAAPAFFTVFGSHTLARLVAPFLVMPADVVRLIAGAVQRYRMGGKTQELRLHGPLHLQIQHAVGRAAFQEDRRRPAESVVIRDGSQADLVAPLRAFVQEGLQLSIAELDLFLDHQAGKELMKSVVLPGVPTGVLRKRSAGENIRQPHHLPWRFAGQHPA